MRLDVEHWNATLGKRYPVTVNDKGWVYGVWYCGTAWDKVRLHGQYPPNFLKRALALFPDAERILQCPSGTVTGPGVTADLIADQCRRPQVLADASRLPFRDGTFELVLTDPPYTPKDSTIYGCPPYSTAKAMLEFHRVLEVGGYVGVLHTFYPSYRRKDWQLEGLIAVVTGFQRATRMFSIFRKLPPYPQGRLL